MGEVGFWVGEEAEQPMGEKKIWRGGEDLSQEQWVLWRLKRVRGDTCMEMDILKVE